jgi:capsular polysaccharide biosynthesis protein
MNQEKNMEEEDTIELIDLLRVVWKWRWFIIIFTFLCAMGAGIISLAMPQVHNISMVIEPGTVGTDEHGKLVCLDSPDNIKSLIEGGAYNQSIIDTLNLNGEKKVNLTFQVSHPKDTKIIKVVIQYNYTERDTGIKVLQQLYEDLFKKYQRSIDLKQRIFDTKIALKDKQKDKLENKIMKIGKTLKIDEAKEKFLVEELKKVKDNTEIILKKRDVLLSNKTNNNGISALLYSNIVQQNMIYTNQLDTQLQSIKTGQEDLKMRVADLKKQKEEIDTEIESIKLEKAFVENIKYIQKPQVSINPIKPKKQLNVILAFVVGLFVSIFLSFFIEYIQKMKNHRSYSSSSTSERPSERQKE